MTYSRYSICFLTLTRLCSNQNKENCCRCPCYTNTNTNTKCVYCSLVMILQKAINNKPD